LTIPYAVEYSLQKGAKIINQSFRVTNQDFGSRIPTREACRRFAQSGGLIFAGAGNDCENESNPFIEVPARVDSVVAVGAVDSLLQAWDYSCDGPELDLVAPAGYRDPAASDSAFHWAADNYQSGHPQYNPGSCNCSSRVPDGKYTLFGGTSAATPMVAGIAALVWSQRPELTAPQVKALLFRSARDLGPAGRDNRYGYGVVDAYRAVTRWGTLGNTNFWSGDIHISGDLTVAQGDSLVLAAGTRIYVARDDNEVTGTDTTKVEIVGRVERHT
jgi:subtilisin family serine protease